MIGSEFHPDQFQSHAMVVPKVQTEDLAIKAEALDVIEVDGQQYAKLPEGWPAADAKDLEEAHAEAVANDEPETTMPDWERELYTWTAAEVKELVEYMRDQHEEIIALRKGMKTMQRKTRKQNQVQRRLERRLAQARSGREQLRATAGQLVQRKLDDAVATLAELIEEKGLIVREGK
jgi:hypothetical protein